VQFTDVVNEYLGHNSLALSLTVRTYE